MFHLTTHAFFKALLFLGAGSVIIALHHEQDIWKMGGLRKKMPVTFWTFIIGTLALCGVPPFSGFYSKDSILAQALEQKNYPLFVLGVFVAGLTTFYMFRLFYVAFLGESPKDGENCSGCTRTNRPPSWPGHCVCWRCSPSLAASSASAEFTTANSVQTPAEHASSSLQKLIEPFAHSPVVAIIGIACRCVGLFRRADALSERRNRSVARQTRWFGHRDEEPVLLR